MGIIQSNIHAYNMHHEFSILCASPIITPLISVLLIVVWCIVASERCRRYTIRSVLYFQCFACFICVVYVCMCLLKSRIIKDNRCDLNMHVDMRQCIWIMNDFGCVFQAKLFAYQFAQLPLLQLMFFFFLVCYHRIESVKKKKKEHTHAYTYVENTYLWLILSEIFI